MWKLRVFTYSSMRQYTIPLCMPVQLFFMSEKSQHVVFIEP